MKERFLHKNYLQLVVFVFIACLSIQTVQGQEVLDVLPDDGRNELFHDYLMEELNVLHNARVDDLNAALVSQELMEARQAKLRANYRMLIGDLPEKTPLNPDVVSTINGDGYNIDLLSYESRPNHRVTANFYYPTTGDGPWPGVIFTVGHYSNSKAQDLMQRIGILLANNGIATLIVDPICQLERYQIKNPDSPDLLKFIGQSGTKQHTLLDVGSMLTGTSIMAYELWDNHRGVDYLLTRPEVDTAKIGSVGDSGGGSQAMYLSAFDSRIKVSVVGSLIMNEPTLYGTIGPQTGSQNLSYEGAYGIDHPEYIEMFAPKPYMIVCDTSDFFAVEGTQETQAEVQQVYDLLGVPEKFGYSAHNTGHGFNSAAKREAIATWLRTWFYDDATPVVDPENQTIRSNADLQVTTSGQVYYDSDVEVVVEDYNGELADSYASQRADFWTTQTKDSCLNMVRNLLRLEDVPGDVTAEVVETYDRGSYDVEKIKLSSGNMVPVTGLLFVPHDLTEKVPAVLFVDGRGKSTFADAGSIIEKVYVDSGKVVFAIDVRGFGETKDNAAKNESKHENLEHRNAVISAYIGKTLIGQRVQDINMAKEYLFGRDEVDTENVSIIGADRAGTAVLHAAALDSDYTDVTIRASNDTSFVSIVKSPTLQNMLTHVVPSALKYYDLEDLVDAIAPRSVSFKKSMDSRLSRIAVTGGTLNPSFSSGVYDYEVVNPTRQEIKVTAYLKDSNASLSGDGTFQLQSTPITVEIDVVAEDGVSTSVYTVELPEFVSIEEFRSAFSKNGFLQQNYPNPFSGTTTIAYKLHKPGKVTLKVYNQLAQEVGLLVDKYQSADKYQMLFDAEGLEEGLYFYRLEIDGIPVDTKKMSLLR